MGCISFKMLLPPMVLRAPYSSIQAPARSVLVQSAALCCARTFLPRTAADPWGGEGGAHLHAIVLHYRASLTDRHTSCQRTASALLDLCTCSYMDKRLALVLISVPGLARQDRAVGCCRCSARPRAFKRMWAARTFSTSWSIRHPA